MYKVAVDIGGTFTDLVVEDDGGRLRTTKVLSTPPHLVDGVIDALELSGASPDQLDLFIHGTTAGLNALLERRGARVALVTTEGFRDVYLIGRGHRPSMYDLRYRKPARLLDRASIFEIRERLAADGSAVIQLSVESIDAVAEKLSAGGYDVVAVCLLHSYANPKHELAVRKRLEAALPGVSIVLSHEVAPEWREYERTSTTVMSAYVTPIMKQYLTDLHDRLKERGLKVPLYITQSNGGVMSSEVAGDRSIATLFSGPVGGVVGGRAAGALIGERNLISIDVGGTSFDVSLVKDGETALQPEYELQGLPVLAPAIEVHTIGAGGGSLIYEASGRLNVGPQSAGAEPGPACYGRGGVQATITDANVALGRLPSETRLAGRMALDRQAAIDALQRVGELFGMDATTMAEQALEIVHFKMAEAIRELTVERGLHPKDFVLCAFGGAGGMHATALADELEIDRILIPAMPGAFSAWGMLQGNIRHDSVQTFYRSFAKAGKDLDKNVGALTAKVTRLLEADGVAPSHMKFETAADLRYVGQEYTLTLPLKASRVKDLDDAFHAAYQQRYGHASPGEPIEFVALRVAGIAELGRPVTADGRSNGRPKADRWAEVRIDGKPTKTALYQRDRVPERFEGPAIVMEETATTLIPTGWKARGIEGAQILLERM
ncbi:MAG: hydantoinase/oxoprolinase family protein [Candidatus Dormibacteraceae bacterium]